MALAAIADAPDSAALRKVAADLAHKKSTLNAVRAKLGTITDGAEKKLIGQALSEASGAIEGSSVSGEPQQTALRRLLR